MSKNYKAALLAMRALRKHATAMKLKGDMKADPAVANKVTAEGSDPEDKPDPELMAGKKPDEDDEFFEPYKPYKPKPVSEKMTMIQPRRTPMGKAVDAVEGPAKRGPGRPPKQK